MSRLAERYRSARRDPNLVVLEGFHCLKHALRFGAEVLDARTSDLAELERLSERMAPDLRWRLLAQVEEIDSEALRALVPRPPATGVVALAQRPTVDPEDMLRSTVESPVVLLERPAHLGNLGAVVRVAAAAGAAGVLSVGDHDPWSPDAVRGGAGLQFALPVARLESFGASPGRPLVGLDPAAVTWTPADGAVARRSVLAFGSERRGLSALLLSRCDRRLALPMRAGVSSLNLATSVAAMLYLVGAGAVPAGLPFSGPGRD